MVAPKGVITHPEKVLFPEDGITKGELAAYYRAVAPLMLPHLVGRPVTLERYPSGIAAEGFMQKSVVKGFPEWLPRVTVPKKGGSVHHPLANDLDGLLWMANQNTVTLHVWSSRLPHLEHPDVLVVDLDPPEGLGPAAVRDAALRVRDLLAELGLASFVKTSGSKGFHVLVPIADTDWAAAAAFTHALGHVLVSRDPDHLTMEFTKVDRGGRIYVDVGRTGPGATFTAAYTVRAKKGAPVTAPCTWDEVESGEATPQSFTLRGMSDRISTVGDPWAELPSRASPLGEAAERLARL
jgi:bifunctional non-homologous end joining protein LigD